MITRVFNESVIRDIVLTEGIREWVCVDGVDAVTADLKVYEVHYLLSEAGMFAVNVLAIGMIEFHACIFEQYRGKSYPYIQEAIRYGFENFSQRKMVCFIRVDNERALKSAIKNGFRIEGILRKSIPINGVLLDQYVVGLEAS